jgi:hypothetical protein
MLDLLEESSVCSTENALIELGWGKGKVSIPALATGQMKQGKPSESIFGYVLYYLTR